MTGPVTSRGPFKPQLFQDSVKKGKALQWNIFTPGMEIPMLRVLAGNALLLVTPSPFSTAGQAALGSLKTKTSVELGAFRVWQELGESLQYHNLYSDL